MATKPFPGFIGPSYNFVGSKVAGVERLINWYMTPNESSEENKWKDMLAPSPGNAAFGPLPVPAPFNQPNRGLLNQRGIPYGVNGTVVFWLGVDGTYHKIGEVFSDGQPCTMVANGNQQILIISGKRGYIVQSDLNPPTINPITTEGFLGAVSATFQDGYFLTIKPHSNVMQISGDDTTPVGDGRVWSQANVSVQAGQADLLRAIISSREYVHLMGAERSQVYANVGNGIGGFPFQSYNETFIETGIGAVFSLVDLGTSLVWLGEEKRGVRALWRDQAFNPQRASTFAIEQQWQNYYRIDNAVAFAFIWRGHLMYQITFPTAFTNNPVSGWPLPPPPDTTYTAATWVYDVTASELLGKPVWHERQFLTNQGFTVGRPELFHCFAYGRHLVGSGGTDGNPGAIYQYSDEAAGYTDCAVDIDGAQVQQNIVRDRIVPHMWSSNRRIKFGRIEFELARGVGVDGDDGPGTDPYLLIRISNDGGNTFGPEDMIPAGKIGQFSRRAYRNRNGSARDRVWWIRCTDPVYWAFTAAMVDAEELLV